MLLPILLSKWSFEIFLLTMDNVRLVFCFVDDGWSVWPGTIKLRRASLGCLACLSPFYVCGRARSRSRLHVWLRSLFRLQSKCAHFTHTGVVSVQWTRKCICCSGGRFALLFSECTRASCSYRSRLHDRQLCFWIASSRFFLLYFSIIEFNRRFPQRHNWIICCWSYLVVITNSISIKNVSVLL